MMLFVEGEPETEPEEGPDKMSTSTARDDIHRPAEMDPASYHFAGTFDSHDDGGMATEFRNALDKQGFRGGNWDTKGTCDHCGALIRYCAVLVHRPSGTLIVVGETCLDNRFSLESKGQFDALRKRAANARQAERIKTEARSYVAGLLETSDPVGNRLGLAMTRDEQTKTYTDLSAMLKPGWALATFTDIRRKVWDVYGSPTTRQQDLLIRLLDEGAEWHARKAAPATEAPKCDAPEGRQTFQGVVVFRKAYEGDYGVTVKILVVVTEDDGSEWSVFVTEPKAITSEKGDIVRMIATLKPGRSSHEAKGSRPSKAEVVGKASELEALPTALD